ncbi:hypothetical protein KA478_03255 [Patescibacteria group bacterium]|nr:hypothetical protein [Patescibacteria group bacterium]
MSKYITPEEYIVRNNYEITNCDQPDYTRPVGVDQKPTMRTDAEKETCKTDAKANLLLRRSIDTKESVIGGLIRGSIALILFITHFPVMLRRGQEETVK